MKFFIDTANLEQIRKAHELGVLDGVTTNPSLMAKEPPLWWWRARCWARWAWWTTTAQGC